jgi:uncharacterized protein YjbJ (UPF0337 family)
MQFAATRCLCGGAHQFFFKLRSVWDRTFLRRNPVSQSSIVTGAIHMNKDQVTGTAKEIAGHVQEIAGKVIDSKEQQAKGLEKQVEGKAEQMVGNIKEIVKDAVDKL